MPKKPAKQSGPVLDQLLLVGLTFGALTIIAHKSWPGTMFEVVALLCGVIWSYRAITTNPSKVFRAMATLVLVLIGIWIWLALVSMYNLV